MPFDEHGGYQCPKHGRDRHGTPIYQAGYSRCKGCGRQLCDDCLNEDPRIEKGGLFGMFTNKFRRCPHCHGEEFDYVPTDRILNSPQEEPDPWT